MTVHHIYTHGGATEKSSAPIVTRTPQTAHFFPDASKPEPVRTDIRAAPWLHERVVGPVQAAHTRPGWDVVISAFATSPGTVHVEDSTDGITAWTTVLKMNLEANEEVGCRFAPGFGSYRVTWDSSWAASKVLVQSQMVPPWPRPAVGPAYISAKGSPQPAPPVFTLMEHIKSHLTALRRKWL